MSIGSAAAKAGNWFKKAGKSVSESAIGQATKKAGQKAGDVTSKAVEKVQEEGVKEATKSVGKSAVGGAIGGGLIGGGVGGVAGIATGADEDNTKSLIVTGALAGAFGGAAFRGIKTAIKGGAKAGGKAVSESTELAIRNSNEIIESSGKAAAKDMAEGATNHAVNDGAKGMLGNAGAKFDDIGTRIRNRVDNVTADEVKTATREYRRGEEALDVINANRDNISKENYDNLMEAANKYMNPRAETAFGSTKANVIAKSAQGGMIGAGGGAIIGGVDAAVDGDDDTSIIGGIVRGGLIGGLVGGAAGGTSHLISGNNGGRLFGTANTSAL